MLRRAVYTTGQVAKLCRVAPRTVSKWFDAGKLRGYRIPGSQYRRVPHADLVRFAVTYGLPLPFGADADKVAAVDLPQAPPEFARMTSYQAFAAAFKGEVAAVVTGAGDGLAAACDWARELKALAPIVRVGLVLGPDGGDVPSGLFDAVWPDGFDPAVVRAWAAATPDEPPPAR